MAKFVTLSRIPVNVDRIAWIERDITSSKVWFSARNDDWVRVDETPDEILALIAQSEPQQ